MSVVEVVNMIHHELYNGLGNKILQYKSPQMLHKNAQRVMLGRRHAVSSYITLANYLSHLS